MHENLDIWSEILRYFTIREGHETKEEIVAKRRMLLNVALLSPTLTDITLDVLWRSMTCLEPICQAINSRDSGNNTLAFKQDDSGGYWVGIP